MLTLSTDLVHRITEHNGIDYVVLWEGRARFNRDGSTRELGEMYWSIDKILLNRGDMPQVNRNFFSGTLAIFKLQNQVVIPRNTKMIGPYYLGGVVEALNMGIQFPEAVRDHQEILAPGSIGPLYSGPQSHRCRFCPCLRAFSDNEGFTVSPALKLLDVFEIEDRMPYMYMKFPAGTKILVALDG